MAYPSQTFVKRRALLIFADSLALDLSRRRLPGLFRSLFDLQPVLESPLGADVHLFTSTDLKSSPAVTVHRQHGATFAARLEAAVEKVAARGYDEVVLIGRDCPDLHQDDIATAFRELENRQLVLGPDHRGGCYLIALRVAERALLRGIRWKENTDAAQLSARVQPAQLFLLPVKQDLDSWADLKLRAQRDDRVGRLAHFLLAVVTAAGREFDFFVDLVAQFMRIQGQMPPPLAAV